MSARTPAPAAQQRRALLFIFITAMLNSMGIGIIMPVMPDLLLELTGDGAAGAIGRAAAWGGWLSASYAIMQFLFSPTLGNLSDRFGRRPVLLISLFIMGIDYVLMAITPSLTVLFAARIMAGMAGATFSTANAYIADISSPEKRAQNFGLTGAAFGIGFVMGPVLGGLVGEFGPRMPFYAAAVLTFANFIFGWIALPESLRPENRRPFSPARANPFGAALQILNYPAVAWMMLALFFYSMGHYIYPVIWSYYTKLKFDWSPLDIGLSLATVGVGFAIVQGLLIRRIIPWLGEARTVAWALALDIIALGGIALAAQGWIIYALMPIVSLSALVSPALQALMANQIADDAQGELQGAVSALNSLAFAVTPIVMSQLFFVFTKEHTAIFLPGAPFLAAACLSGFALAIFIMTRRRA